MSDTNTNKYIQQYTPIHHKGPTTWHAPMVALCQRPPLHTFYIVWPTIEECNAGVERSSCQKEELGILGYWRAEEFLVKWEFWWFLTVKHFQIIKYKHDCYSTILTEKSPKTWDCRNIAKSTKQQWVAKLSLPLVK